MSVISRRRLMRTISASLTLMLGGWAKAETPRVIAGAIRWDAWYEKRDDSKVAQDNLAPEEFRYRAPIHCKSEKEVLFCNGTVATMDAEILSARRAGIEFWAFDWYSPDSSLHKAWDLYQSSSIRNFIKWCPIISLEALGSYPMLEVEVTAKIDFWVNHMTSSDYYKATVRGENRPVLFIYFRRDELDKYFKSLGALEKTIRELRYACLKKDIGNPYVVIFDPAVDMAIFSGSGADAISNYIGGFVRRPAGSFKDLDVQIQGYWEKMASTGADMIPISQVGWDTRPRQHLKTKSVGDMPNGKDAVEYYDIATPRQFFEHIQSAVKFIKNHSASCASNILLLYSWDECDEGGCIMPTLGDPEGSYLSALSVALKS